MDGAFDRVVALLGETARARLASARVLVVGIGGVGSWCAEALVRTGVGHVTIMDDDCVAASNLNRQCPATALTIGQPKVEAMKARLLSINPACEVVARRERFTDRQQLSALDGALFVVDAIDDVVGKVELILGATERKLGFVSSMGAALRTDPTKVRVTRFERVEGDGLARALRQRFKKLRCFPAAKFSCVWSAEPPNGTADRSAARGSLMPVTATFGMCLANELIQLIIRGEAT